MPFETITTFESHPKCPSSPMMYPIQLGHKSAYCQEFWCRLPLILAELCSFPCEVELLDHQICLIDILNWYIFRPCNPFTNRFQVSKYSVDKGVSYVNTSYNEDVKVLVFLSPHFLLIFWVCLYSILGFFELCPPHPININARIVLCTLITDHGWALGHSNVSCVFR